jgi:hypothetical protein
MSWNYPDNWYWSVQDSSPGTEVWQSSSGSFVVLANADYVAFLAAGNLASIIDTLVDLYVVINTFNASLTRQGLGTISISGGNYSIPVATNSPIPDIFIIQSIDAGGRSIILPQADLFGCIPTGSQIIFGNFDIHSNSITIKDFEDGFVVATVPHNAVVSFSLLANTGGASNWLVSYITNDATPITVPHGGTGNTAFTAHGVLIGEGTSSIASTAAGASANLLIGQGAADPTWNAMSGDATITNAGVITVAKVNGVSFPSSFTSGGIPYASASNTIASSGALTLNGVVYGGGAGASPLSTAQGGANTVLIANAGAPSFSAAPVIGTSVTTPISYGGSAAGSTKTINGTSNGSPSSAYLLLQTNGQFTQIGASTLAPDALLTINNNTDNVAAVGLLSTTMVHLVQADSPGGAVVVIDTWGSNGAYNVRRADGTQTAKSAVAANAVIMQNLASAWNGSAYNAPAAIRLVSGELQSGTAGGGYFSVLTTALGTLSIQENFRFQGSGGLTIGNAILTTDPGAGSLQLNGQIFAANMTQTSAAVTGTVCWTTGTGKFTIDTTTTCLLSAERYKHDFRPLDETIDSLALVLKANPGSFYYNEDVGIMGEQIGFRAEEIAQLDDRLVSHIPDGRVQSVRYQQYTAVLTRAIQRLNAKVEQMERRVA